MSRILPLSVSVLSPHPQNLRPRLTEAEVVELKASIEAHGQVQPCFLCRTQPRALPATQALVPN